MTDLRPKFRRVRVYAFDPILSTRHDTSAMNLVTLKIPWEVDWMRDKDLLGPGPIGEYVEVIDYDPASQCFYAPVDLNDTYLLAQDGLPPSESNPQFHQQMVYAVIMTTIRNFERALGRCVLWSDRGEGFKPPNGFVRRLRVYPHALREANAYYSPGKKALLFGYFPLMSYQSGHHHPGGMVFTCLSHDIIAHETTHAILDGLHHRFNEESNPDMLAFHEAFADMAALFQHFSLPGVLHHVISRTRGDLARQNLLGQLAQQFGQAIGNRGALRDALGEVDPKTGEWRAKEPDPQALQKTLQPHARGAILVAAVFDAFLTIYKSRIRDLLRIATQGTGVLPEGDLHPDLVGRLAREAGKSASHILQMCIRATDYMPPVDITFGDFLRALITADMDMVPVDERGYRVAIIDSFRKWGIYPRDPEVKSLSEESLCWRPPTREDAFFKAAIQVGKLKCSWKLWQNREDVYAEMKENAAKLHGWLKSARNRYRAARAFGLELSDRYAPPTIFRKNGEPAFQVLSVRPAIRTGPQGEQRTDLVIEITQRRRGYLDPEVQRKEDQRQAGKGRKEGDENCDFIFRGGCTLLVDHETDQLRYVITKNINARGRLERQRAYIDPMENPSYRHLYFGEHRGVKHQEPFALLHRAHQTEGVE